LFAAPLNIRDSNCLVFAHHQKVFLFRCIFIFTLKPYTQPPPPTRLGKAFQKTTIFHTSIENNADLVLNDFFYIIIFFVDKSRI
jgi:hypothetical protein